MSHKLTVDNNKLIIDNKNFDSLLKNYEFNQRLYNISKKKNIVEIDYNVASINITNRQYRKLFKS